MAMYCTQSFQRGMELIEASLRKWLIYPTLIVLTEGGTKDVVPVLSRMDVESGSAIDAYAYDCLCTLSKEQLTSRPRLTGRSTCGASICVQQCHPAIRVDDDTRAKEEMRLVRDDLLASLLARLSRRAVPRCKARDTGVNQVLCCTATPRVSAELFVE